IFWRGLRRTGRGGGAALETLVGELERSAAANLEGAGRAAEHALRDRLAARTAPAGGPALVGAWPAAGRDVDRRTRARAGAADWTAMAQQAVHVLRSAPDPGSARRAQQAVDALGERGLAAVALAAAAGLDPAAVVLEALLGDDAGLVRAALQGALVERAQEQAAREGADLVSRLDGPDLAPDAASRLRLRFAVLKGLT
ncbi:hypothetical protein HIR71_05410, partial [Cellulomonas fimi]|nr:hypothetical protein [Cellulomonas fimi]